MFYIIDNDSMERLVINKEGSILRHHFVNKDAPKIHSNHITLKLHCLSCHDYTYMLNYHDVVWIGSLYKYLLVEGL